MPFDWFRHRPARPAPAAPVLARRTAPPAAIDPATDRGRATMLRLIREDADTPPMATTPAAAAVAPMPGWLPSSRFGMCRNPNEVTR